MKYIKVTNKETGEEIHVSENQDGTFQHYGNVNINYKKSELEFPKEAKLKVEPKEEVKHKAEPKELEKVKK